MEKLIHIKDNKIYYRLDDKYFLGPSYIRFIEKGLLLKYKHGYFKSKYSRKVIGKWWIEDKHWFQKLMDKARFY